MLVDPSDTIAGVPALRVRDFLKRNRYKEWSAEHLRNWFSLTTKDADEVIGALRELRYIEPGTHYPHFFQRTLAGSTFAGASGVRPITRTTAERKVAELLARVKEVNANPYYLYRVVRVRVFGSYLTAQQRLSDVDIVIELTSKEPDRDKAFKLKKVRIADAMAGGRTFSNIVNELFWPEHEVLLYLKARSRTFSFHSAEDGILEQTKVVTIFEA